MESVRETVEGTIVGGREARTEILVKRGAIECRDPRHDGGRQAAGSRAARAVTAMIEGGGVAGESLRLLRAPLGHARFASAGPPM